MVTLRVTMLHLGKHGHPTKYYLKELAILVNTANALRAEIEREEMQLQLPRDVNWEGFGLEP